MKNSINKNYGPWAVITGASSGIGKAISASLASQGMNIVAVARSQQNLQKLKINLETEHSVQVRIIPLDLSKTESSADLDKQTSDLDVGLLVANAGLESDGPFTESDATEELNLVSLNITSPLLLSRLFSKRFKQRGSGGILLTASLFGYQGIPYFANYAASKAYVITLGEALNVELKPFNIDVTVVSPGLTETAMIPGIGVDFGKIPIPQHKPEFVAQAALNALGKKATVVPGLVNKMYAWENRLIPRSWPVKLFGFFIKRARVNKDIGKAIRA